MSRQQHSQGTNTFGDSRIDPAQPLHAQQPDRSIAGDFGAAPTQQRFEPAVHAGDTWNEDTGRRQGPDYQNASSTGTGTGSADVYASHAGQLGATDGRNQFDTTGAVGNTGTGAGRRFDASGQNPQTYGAGSGPVPPPPAVPQPQAHAVQPSTSDKIMGKAEKLAGKIAGNEGLVERGQARKDGTLNPGQF